jgi:hypothetical protein
MKRIHCLGAALVLATSLTALAETPQARAWDQTAAQVNAGEQRLVKARDANSNARRLDALDQAIARFRSARRAAVARRSGDLDDLRVSAERGLVQAYVSKAEIYLARTALTKARDTVLLALDVDPGDARAQNLALRIDAESNTDIFTKYQGTQVIGRVQERRAASGESIRPRGLTGRR